MTTSIELTRNSRGIGRLILAVLSALLAVSQNGEAIESLDLNPLQRHLPPSNLFMPVPNGQLAVTTTNDPQATIEEQRRSRKGGLVYGYCLVSSCSYITHVVIAQVCNNQIGGKDGGEELILGVVRLPFGGRPGKLVTLQGQNYAENFQMYGPTEEVVSPLDKNGSARFALTVAGKGPVAPIIFDGMLPDAHQPEETFAVRLKNVPNRAGSATMALFEIRHLCKVPLS